MVKFKEYFLNNNYEANKHFFDIHREKMKLSLIDSVINDDFYLKNEGAIIENIHENMGINFSKEQILEVLSIDPDICHEVSEYGVSSFRDSISDIVTLFFLNVEHPNYGDKIENINDFYFILNDQIKLFGYKISTKDDV